MMFFIFLLINLSQSPCRFGYRLILGLLLAVFAGLNWSEAGQAQVLEIEPDSPNKSGEIRRGEVSVTLSYPKKEFWQPLVLVKVSGQVVGKLVGAEGSFAASLVQIAELDRNNPYPEVLLSSFTGGAHCCNEVKVLTSDRTGQHWQSVDLGTFDGAPKAAEDLDRDGQDEYVVYDNRFLYRFSSYAGSAAPVQIWQLKGRKFLDVSHQPRFVFIHRRSLNEMSQWFQENNTAQDSNGFLAGYVANKALVGELEEGWALMLKRYDRSSEWGLSDCKGSYDEKGVCRGKEVRYQNFPQALRAFLMEAGYIQSPR